MLAWKFSEREVVVEEIPWGIRERIDGIEGERMLEDIDGRNIGSSAGMEPVRGRLACGRPEEGIFGLL